MRFIICLSEVFPVTYMDVRWKRRKQKTYNPTNLVLAVKSVQDGNMNAYQAAQIYGVPRRTVSYRVQKARERYLMSLKTAAECALEAEMKNEMK
jgi:hypothetical protein